MNNQLKHRTKCNKHNTSTKLLKQEYAIINENGEVQATENKTLAEQRVKEGKQVFIIKTYQLQIKHKLETKED